MFRKCFQNKTEIYMVGDIGGTNTRLSIFLENKTSIFEKNYLNDNYDIENGLEIICKEFIKLFSETHKISKYKLYKVCFGIPSIIKNNKVLIHNRPKWGTIDLSKINFFLSKIFKNQIELYTLNDFQIQSYGIIDLELNNPSTYLLNKGEIKKNTTKAIIGAGTGLGQCFLTFCNGKYIANHSEGGNIDFSPKNKQEIDLLEFILNNLDYQRVTNEDIISGRGIQNIYKFFYFNQYKILPKLNIKTDFISKRSLSDIKNNKTSIFTETMKLWVSIYGSIVGDCVCNILPTGGIYIVGGVAVKNKEWFIGKKSNIFINSYLNKGFLSYTLSKIPIILITDIELTDNLPKYGALYYLNNNI